MTLTYNQREWKLQCAAVIHIDSAFPELRELYTAFPGRPGDAKDGYFKQLMGVKAGVSDILFACMGLIELKVRPGGKVTRQQNMFMSSWARAGWKTKVCWTVREVHDTIKSWGFIPKHEAIIEPDYRTWDEKLEDAMGLFAP